MEIKVEQWVRVKCGLLLKVAKMLDVQFYGFTQDGKFRNDYFENIVKVADTPQELIKIGDMVTDKNEEVTYVVDHIEVRNGNELWFGIISYQSKIVCSMDEISEIWTRTSDNTYTRQWIKES